MKRMLILLFLLILFMPFSLAFAQNMNVDVTPSESIYAGRVAEFDVSIENNGESDWFSLSVFGTVPEWITIEKPSLYIESGKKAVTKIWISPSENALQSTYKYNILVSRATDNSKVEKQILISVLQKSLVVIDSVDASCISCEPGQDISVSAKIKNVGSKTLAGLKLQFEFLGMERIIDIGTMEVNSEKDVVTNFFIDELKEPGTYNVSLKLIKDDTVLDSEILKFSVKGVSNIVSTEKEDNNLFGRYVTIEIVNNGNMKSKYQVTSDCISNWYGAYSGREYIFFNNKCLWTDNIGPGEKIIIKYSEVYWVSILILLALIVFVIYFYMQNTALSIRKKIIRKYPATEGRKYSFSIEVVNRGKSVENIIIRDKVPSMFEIEKSFETVKPVVKKTEKGTELIWKVGRLKSGEVRILHYKVKTLIGLLGNYKMPVAKLTGKLDGKPIIRKSNIVEIYGQKDK